MDLSIPKVMGILNVTSDSFYAQSRTFSDSLIKEKTIEMLEAGVDIIDIGGCSTRPGFIAPSIEEEWERVDRGCRIVRELDLKIPLSIDTFRSEIAEKAIEKWDVGIVNDISGVMSSSMWELVAKNQIAYILTHNNELHGASPNETTARVITELSFKVNELHRLGVNDVIIDPGFGFGKTLEENYQLLSNLEEFSRIDCPLLVGISRKSMIWKVLENSPEDCLAGTITLNTVSLMKGANILRVHDVKEAKDTVKVFKRLS